MSADLLSSRAPAAESQPAAAGLPAEGHTLTLPLRFSRGDMAGRLEISNASAALPDTVHLRVTMPSQEPLNFTA